MLSLFRIFIKVVEQGSFSKAGNILDMAPSSVARSIDKLEAELGTRLLKRSTRQLALTENGLHFYEGAQRLLEDADRLIISVQQPDPEPEGKLRISCFESFGRQTIAPLLPEFLQTYPKVTIEIELENQRVDLNRMDTDLAIRIGRPQDSSLNARFLLQNRTLLCASPAYVQTFGMPEKPEELTKHNCLILGQNRQEVFWHFTRDQDYRKIPVRGNLISRGGTPLLEAARQGCGLLLISQWMIQPHLDRKELVVCLPEWQAQLHESTSGDVYAVYKGGKYTKPALRAFIDYLVEKLVRTASL